MKCKHDNGSEVDFVRWIEEVTTEGEGVALFEEHCSDCGKLIGKELQYFKYVGRESIEIK